MNPPSVSDSYPEGYVPPPRGEDLPYDDGEPMETERHYEQYSLLRSSLQRWLLRQDRHDIYVGGNQFLYYSQVQSKKYEYRGPDVFVVLATDDHERKSWVVWEEGGRTPDVIIEITSPSTESVDRGRKMDIYARLLKTAAYVLYDPFEFRLEGYSLDPARGVYVPLPKDGRGFLPVPPLGLWLGVHPTHSGNVRAPMLRWFDSEGRLIANQEERDAVRDEQERLAVEARARAERDAAAHAERAEKEAERAEKEAERAEKEAERAEKEAERAEKEAERARAAEAEIARLREELRRRGG